MNRAYIIHGWGGNTEESWFPWLKKKLINRDFKVEIPEMPDSDNPKIESWVRKMNEIVKFDGDVILIGHSIGCQTILRYLESLEGKEVRSVILVAPWLRIKNLDENEEEIAKPWVENEINFNNVKDKAKSFNIIYSETDPFPYSEDIELMEKELNAKMINLGDAEHINQESGFYELPQILEIIDGGKNGK